MVQIQLPKDYGYLWDVVKLIKNNKEVPIDEFNLIGGRKSAKTTSLLLLGTVLSFTAPDKVGFICFRDRISDSLNLLEDFIEVLDAYDVPYKVVKSRAQIIVNGNVIRFVGLNSNIKNKSAKKAGLPRFGDVKYAFMFFEERFEFDESDVRSAVEAVRSMGNQKTQYIVLNACNPWAKSSPYIQYCSKIQPWNLNILKETGSQLGIYEVPLGDGYSKRVLMHYTNWRVAAQYLSATEIAKIKETHTLDKARAAVVDYGLPGYEQGAIYTHLLNHIGKAIDIKDQDFFIGGGDYGWGRDAHSGKTAFVFAAGTIDDGLDVYGEYIWWNNEYVKSPNQIADEVIRFYIEQVRQYAVNNGISNPPTLNVRVDLSNIAFIQILNDTARKYRIDHWLKFIKCKKLPITDRIEVTLSLMSRGKLRFANSVKVLKQEMELAQYAEIETQKRVKKNDHCLNAFEYAIEPLMNKFIKEHQLEYVKLKRAKLY